VRPAINDTAPQHYLPFVATALFFGAAGGFPLALAMATSRALDLGFERDWPEMARAHGDNQTWGFVVLFVMGMAFRLMPIFARRPLAQAIVAPPMLGVAAAALLANTLLLPWLHGSAAEVLAVAVAAGFCLLAAGFLALTSVMLRTSRGRSRQTLWSFTAGAGLLLGAALLRLLIALEGVGGSAVYARHASTLLILGGFLIAYIAAVSTRGFRPSPWWERQFIEVLCGLAVLLAASLAYLEYVEQSGLAAAVAAASLAGLGGCWLAAVVVSGIFHTAADRPMIASRPHLWLVRSAFAWLALAGVLAAVTGLQGVFAGEFPGIASIDAIRHALGVGLATTLITGMGLLLLPEFATAPLHERTQSRLALCLLLLLNAATVLRVAAALLGAGSDADLRAWLQTSAGALAETALLIFAAAAWLRRRGPAEG